jgi:hypothetical protein
MAIFDELRSIGRVLQEAGKIEQYQQILDAQEKLLEQQKRIFDLEKENQELKEKFNLKKNLIHRAEVYYLKDGEKEDGPFCAKCYDVEGLLVRMTHWNPGVNRCPNCVMTYKI